MIHTGFHASDKFNAHKNGDPLRNSRKRERERATEREREREREIERENERDGVKRA